MTIEPDADELVSVHGWEGVILDTRRQGQVTNTGVPYERLVRDIFEKALRASGGITNLEVEHNYTARGRSGDEHQVDVCWRFKVGGVAYMTFVSCKDWGSAVPMDVARTMHDILEDVPGQPRGIIISRHGFQSGTRDFAARRGIILYTLRESEGGEKFKNSVTVRVPSASDIAIEFDNEWTRDQLVKLHLTPGETVHRSVGGQQDDELWVYDEDDTPILRVSDIRDSLFDRFKTDEIPSQRVEHRFTEPAYVHNEAADPRLPRLKIRGISCEIARTVRIVRLTIGIQEVATFVIQDVQRGTTGLIDRDLGAIVPWF